MFRIISDKFFVPLASPNKLIYWECICKLFTIMNHQLSFGVERDILVEELQYYFEQVQAISIEDDEIYMYFNTSITPCLVEPVEGNAFEYLILPVRITSN